MVVCSSNIGATVWLFCASRRASSFLTDRPASWINDEWRKSRSLRLVPPVCSRVSRDRARELASASDWPSNRFFARICGWIRSGNMQPCKSYICTHNRSFVTSPHYSQQICQFLFVQHARALLTEATTPPQSVPRECPQTSLPGLFGPAFW